MRTWEKEVSKWMKESKGCDLDLYISITPHEKEERTLVNFNKDDGIIL